MMAVTIRNTEEHEKMLDDLKRLTNTNAVSKALIQGGYEAIRYQDWYKTEKAQRERVERELKDLQRKVRQYFEVKSELEATANKS